MNRSVWFDDDEPDYGFCQTCGTVHRLDMRCVVAEERGRMALVAVLCLAFLTAAVGVVGWWWIA
jgi:hypothetical protein